MSVEFKCEHCDMLLSADVEAGGQVTCPHCQSVTIVPEGLASLPSPKVPGEPVAPPPDGAGGEEGDDEEELEEEPGESHGVMRALSIGTPWLISLFFHGAILLILSLWVIYTILDEEDRVEQPKPVEIREEPEIYTDVMTTEESDARERTDRNLSNIDRPSLDKSASSDIPRAISMTNTGSPGGGGDIPGLGGDGGGGGGLFGSPRQGAQNVVYVIDRSGSMHKTFGLVRRNLLDSIGKLSDSQDFHVILFAAGSPLEKSPTRLTTATDDAKASAGEFLQGKEARGVTDPIKALKRAFTVLSRASTDRKGKLIQLLTDGNFPDNEEVLDLIKRLNKTAGGDVHINTFLYGNRPVEAEALMKQIAAENRGDYKYVSPDEAY